MMYLVYKKIHREDDFFDIYRISKNKIEIWFHDNYMESVFKKVELLFKRKPLILTYEE